MDFPVLPAEEPPGSLGDARELLDAYLDYYRGTVLRKLDGLGEEELRGSRLPSGWSDVSTFATRRERTCG